MGLDISFNRKDALKAGLVVTVDWDEDTRILETIIQVPDTDIHVLDSGYEESICIRANKWGRVYEPMTNWLKANSITWGEF